MLYPLSYEGPCSTLPHAAEGQGCSVRSPGGVGRAAAVECSGSGRQLRRPPTGPSGSTQARFQGVPWLRPERGSSSSLARAGTTMTGQDA